MVCGTSVAISNQEELVTGLNNHAKNAASVKHTVAERVLKMNRGRSGESVIKISISSSTIQCSDVSKPHVPSRTYPSAHELVKQEEALFPFGDGLRWIDMRFLPHITEGEVRLILDGDECIAVVQRPHRFALCAQAGAAWVARPPQRATSAPLRPGIQLQDTHI